MGELYVIAFFMGASLALCALMLALYFAAVSHWLAKNLRRPARDQARYLHLLK